MNSILKYSFALLLLVASCAKNDFYKEEESEGKLITANFNNNADSTKTTLGGTNGLTPMWANGDKIKLYDEKNNTATITLSTSEEASTTIGLISDDDTFKFIKPSNLTGETLYAVYPSTAGAGVDNNGHVQITIPATTNGTFGEANICAAQTTSETLSFKNAVAIIKVADKTTSIISIVLNGTGICGTFPVDLSGDKASLGDGSSTGDAITITPSSIDGPFYAAIAPITVPAGTFAEYYNGSTKITDNAKTLSSSKTFAINKLYDMGYALPVSNGIGVFKVSATKKVTFAPANLYWDGSAFKFETNQTDYDKGTYNEKTKDTKYTSTHVSHFFWTKTAENSYAETYSDGTQTDTDVSWLAESKGGITVDGVSGWYALTGGSEGEWKYLITGRTNASSLYKYPVTVTDGATTPSTLASNCLIIAPDGYSGTLSSEYTLDELNDLGIVCLPPAGGRFGSILLNSDPNGYYWSSTPADVISTYICYAHDLIFTSTLVVSPGDVSLRFAGAALRLVR